jgi:branched-chain amino acid transport system substrate-binding protein
MRPYQPGGCNVKEEQRMKRSLILCLVAPLVLGACGGGVGQPSAAPSQPASAGAKPSAAPAVSSPAAGAQPPGPAAKPSIPPAGAAAGSAAKQPIKVGIIEPLTGSFAPLGNENADGFKTFLNSIRNTAAGRQIEPIFADDQAKPDVTLTKAKELVENQKVVALMGFNTTPSAYAVAQWVKTSHVPMMITTNAAAENMLTDAKFASPYLTRWTETFTQVIDPTVDWLIKQGHRKAIIVSADFAPGIQVADLFASGFIRKGGSILQEFYPAVATTDFGPFLAQFNQSADVVYVFVPGVDSLRFADQYSSYSGQKKPLLFDGFGLIGAGPVVAQLKDKVDGVVSADVFDPSSVDPGTKAFLKEWNAAHPGQPLSINIANGYASGQILASAIEKAGGSVEDPQRFLQALYSLQLDTGKGPVRLDQNHDIVENVYIFRTEKAGNDFVQKTLQTYTEVSDSWGRSAEEIAKFPFEKYKGKWVGMTKDQVAQALK